MVVELVIGSTLVGLGLVALRKLQRGERPPKRDAAPPEDGLAIGQVLLVGGNEFWLAGSLDLDDGAFVCRIFACPGAGPEYVLQRDREGQDLALLSRADRLPQGSLPRELVHQGERFRQHRAGVARVSRRGEHLPVSSSPAHFALYQSQGDQVLVVLEFETGDRLGLTGGRLLRAHCDLLPAPTADQTA